MGRLKVPRGRSGVPGGKVRFSGGGNRRVSPSMSSDQIAHYQGLLAGLKANAGDFSGFQTEVTSLETLTNEAVQKNQAQENAAAKYHQLTEELNRTMGSLKDLVARLESAVYTKYGKKSDKLEEFDLKAWKPGGRRGQRGAQSTG